MIRCPLYQRLHQCQRLLWAAQAQIAHRQQNRLPPPGLRHPPRLAENVDNFLNLPHTLHQIVGAEKLLEGQVDEAVDPIPLVQQTAPLAHGRHKIVQPVLHLLLGNAPGQMGTQPGAQLTFVHTAPARLPRSHQTEGQPGQQIALLVLVAAPIHQIKDGVGFGFIALGQEYLHTALVEFGPLVGQAALVVVDNRHNCHQQGRIDEGRLAPLLALGLQGGDSPSQGSHFGFGTGLVVGSPTPALGQRLHLLCVHRLHFGHPELLGQHSALPIGPAAAGHQQISDTPVGGQPLHLLAHLRPFPLVGHLIQPIQEQNAALALVQQTGEEVVGQPQRGLVADETVADKGGQGSLAGVRGAGVVLPVAVVVAEGDEDGQGQIAGQAQTAGHRTAVAPSQCAGQAGGDDMQKGRLARPRPADNRQPLAQPQQLGHIHCLEALLLGQHLCPHFFLGRCGAVSARRGLAFGLHRGLQRDVDVLNRQAEYLAFPALDAPHIQLAVALLHPAQIALHGLGKGVYIPFAHLGLARRGLIDGVEVADTVPACKCAAAHRHIPADSRAATRVGLCVLGWRRQWRLDRWGDRWGDRWRILRGLAGEQTAQIDTPEPRDQRNQSQPPEDQLGQIGDALDAVAVHIHKGQEKGKPALRSPA